MGKDGSAVQKVHATLGARIATLYKHPSPQTNLQDLINDLEKKHQYALMYAKHATKYEFMISGLRTKAVLMFTLTLTGAGRMLQLTSEPTNLLFRSLVCREKSQNLAPLKSLLATILPKSLALKIMLPRARTLYRHNHLIINF